MNTMWLQILGARAAKGDEVLDTCEVCGCPTQAFMTIKDQLVIRPSMCACKRKARDEWEKRRAIEEEELMRRRCFGARYEGKSQETFQNDDRRNPGYSQGMMRYCERFDEIRDTRKNGFVLYGPVGTGKSFYAAEVCNELIHRGYTAMYVPFHEVANKLTNYRESKADILHELCEPTLLVLDDMGLERDSAAMAEACWSIIDARYASRKPMIITTNLDPKIMTNEVELRKRSMYDRIFERCDFFLINGASRRRERSDSMADIMALMKG